MNKRRWANVTSKEYKTLFPQLNWKPWTVTEKQMGRYIPFSRNDARIAEMITENIRDFWWKYDPQVINKELLKYENSNLIHVMIYQILKYCKIPNKNTEKNFKAWAKELTKGIHKGDWGLAFVPHTMSPKYAQKILESSTEDYLKYNFYGSPILFNKEKAKELSSPWKNERLRNELRLNKLKESHKIRNYIIKNRVKKIDFSKKNNISRPTLDKIVGYDVDKVSYDKIKEISDSL